MLKLGKSTARAELERVTLVLDLTKQANLEFFQEKCMPKLLQQIPFKSIWDESPVLFCLFVPFLLLL